MIDMGIGLAAIRNCVVLGAMLMVLAGCAALPFDNGRQGTDPPPGMSRDELLSGIAACHLLRVVQTEDIGSTDSLVIASVERYGFSVEEMVTRANALVEGVRTPADSVALHRLATVSCERLADLTGLDRGLVRFGSMGELEGTWAVVRGEIADGFADEVIAELRRRKAIGLIIESRGGSVYEARRLGRWLRANGLRVAVDRLCTSACVDVLAGGVARVMTPGARVGIHQSKAPVSQGSHEGGQLAVVSSVLYLREMGIDDDIALAAAAVPNDKLYWISTEEALETGLVTDIVDRL
jgi:ATP-dependent protease ClpP protease subunit